MKRPRPVAKVFVLKPAHGAAAALLVLASLVASPLRAMPAGADLADLSLEELSDIEISSVSRRSEKLSQVAASLYVISGDAIERAGARTLPEALRLAPNLQVAQVDANQYAISARGFNNTVGNKLLVLIDGRTIYAPYFSGVQWDQQDLVLEDVARIEVISGPGGSVWGTNAVNGVINIVTKSAAETQGWLAEAGDGNTGSQAALRFGGNAGAGKFRVYAKLRQQQHTDTEAGAPVADGSHREQFGWRADWLQAGDGLTLQGDAYRQNTQSRFGLGMDFGGIKTSGENVLARWTDTLQDGSKLRVQGYYDHSRREDRFIYSPEYAVVDLEFQHSLTLGPHQIDWGGGWRQARDDIQPGLLFGFVPEQATQSWRNLFLQDDYRLSEHVNLIAGTKFEHNDYTGWESLPSLRLAWAPSPAQLWWAGLSRAVRAPARLDRDLRLPGKPPFLIAGGPNFDSEVANVLELGYRAQPSRALNFSATLYRYDWNRLRSGEPPPNAQVQNMIYGNTYGLEAWGRWQALGWLQFSAGLDLLRKDLGLRPGSTDPTGPSALGDDPQQQWQLRASMQLPHQQALELGLRRVAALPNPSVPGYTSLDLNYVWRLHRGLELSLVGQNLLDPRHPESDSFPSRSDFKRSIFAQLRWSR